MIHATLYNQPELGMEMGAKQTRPPAEGGASGHIMNFAVLVTSNQENEFSWACPYSKMCKT